MWKYSVTAGVLIFGLSAAPAAAFEWNGFNSGMTPAEVEDAAAAQGLDLDRNPDEAENITIALYSSDDGNSRGFVTLCQGQLARVGTELRELDVGQVARTVDRYAEYGPPQVQTVTLETGARGVEFSWAAESDEIGLIMIRMGNEQYMQETMADIGLWDLCANTGAALDEEPVDDFDRVDEDQPPPTPEELILDALGRAMRGENGDDGQ